MAVYPPPTENLPIFDNEVFITGDEALTYNEAKKKFLRYPTAQGKETLQAVDVNGLATLFNKTVMTRPSTVNDSILEITSTVSTNNNGIKLTNSAINQTGSSLINTTNQFGPSKIQANCTWNIDKQATVAFDALPVGGVTPQQYSLTASNTSNLKINSITNNVTTNLIDVNGSTLASIAVPMNATYTMPASSDSSQRVPSTAWVQSAISATSVPINPSFNTVNITPLPGASATSTTGIVNQTNMNGFFGQFPYYVNNGVQGYFAFNASSNTYYTSLRPIKIDFINNLGSNPTFAGFNNCCTFELDMFFYDNPNINWGSNSGAWGQTSLRIHIFESALTTDWGDVLTTSGTKNLIYNINNKINGNASFNYQDATHAPNGRQYWSYSQNINSGGNTIGNAYLSGANQGGGIYRVSIYPIFPNTSYSYYYSIRCLSTNPAQADGNGVLIYS